MPWEKVYLDESVINEWSLALPFDELLAGLRRVNQRQDLRHGDVILDGFGVGADFLFFVHERASHQIVF